MLRVALLVCLAVLPLIQTNGYWTHVFTSAAIAAILAMSLQLLVGMAGLLSLGQAAFYGIGAYASAIMTVQFGWPFALALVGSALVAGLFSLLLIPMVRLKGPSLAVATLGFGIIVHLVLLNEDWLTGGSIGIMAIPHPGLFGWEIASERGLYYLCVTIAFIVYLGLSRIEQSRFGRGLLAMGQDEDAARACGIAITRTKAKCFLLAALTAGLAGSLYASTEGYLSPDDFAFTKSIDVLIMVVVGGLGSLPGAAAGAALLVVSAEVLRVSGEFRIIIIGLAVIVLMGLRRRGLAGLAGALAHIVSSRAKRTA